MDRQVFLLVIQSRIDCTTSDKLTIAIFNLACADSRAPVILVSLYIRRISSCLAICFIL